MNRPTRQVGTMSIFHDPKDEERLYHVLRAYVEEWGPHNVVISVPPPWRKYSPADHVGGIRLEYENASCVSVRVEYHSVQLSYAVRLRAA